jgi:uracil-DNA glycosylase family 4
MIMGGFFSKQEIQSENITRNRNLSCYSCRLYKGDINSPKMEPTGNFKKKILNIGEFVTEQEDQAGRYYFGNILKSAYQKLGIDIEEDCLNVKATMCHAYDKTTNKSRIPTQHEIDCCRINMLKLIKQHKPKLIVLFGRIPLMSIIGHRWKGSLEGVDKWRGFIIPDQEFKCWIAPMYSPSYIKQVEKDEVTLIWQRDLSNAVFNLEHRDFPVYKEPTIHLIDNPAQLPKIEFQSAISFDYETTGLKPHAKGHRIICVSLAVNEDEVYAFEMPKELSKREPFLNILKDKNIKKMAHNMKYEDTWSLIRLKTKVRNWYWDSMLAAHIIDNRPGVTGLKFQTYVNFGISDYNETVKYWLNAIDDKNANSLNRIQEYFNTKEGRKEILTYCALDSIFQYRLATRQMKQIEVLSLPF